MTYVVPFPSARLYTDEEVAERIAEALAQLPPDASDEQRDQCRINVLKVMEEMRFEALTEGLERELRPFEPPPPPPDPAQKRRLLQAHFGDSLNFEQSMLAELREEQAARDAERAAVQQELNPLPKKPKRRTRKRRR